MSNFNLDGSAIIYEDSEEDSAVEVVEGLVAQEGEGHKVRADNAGGAAVAVAMEAFENVNGVDDDKALQTALNLIKGFE